MKLVIAYVNTFKLDDVRDALRECGVSGLSASQIQGFGSRRAEQRTETYRGAEYSVDFSPKARLELVIDDGLLEAVVSTIEKSAHTGHPGDGKVTVLPVEEFVRIRTGERGAAAL